VSHCIAEYRCNAQEIQDQAEESFEEKEDELFRKWYEANSDITTNKRHNAWLKMHHPEHVWMKPLSSTGVEHFFVYS